MDKRLKYLPAYVIPILVCGFGWIRPKATFGRKGNHAHTKD